MVVNLKSYRKHDHYNIICKHEVFINANIENIRIKFFCLTCNRRDETLNESELIHVLCRISSASFYCNGSEVFACSRALLPKIQEEEPFPIGK
jgi:hypothetical protein